jgi:hypothetical protein
MAASGQVVGESREIAATPQLGDAQLDRSRASLPVAVAVALVAPLFMAT